MSENDRELEVKGTASTHDARGSCTRLPPEDPSGIRRVQVGCGPQHLRPDWWNVDIRGFKGIDEIMDAAQPWRWVDLLDYVYCEHFLEHLDPSSAVSFLRAAGCSLRKGGRIRISTPGLEWVLKTHFKFAQPESNNHIQETWSINRAFHGWGHQFLYSRGMLTWLLTSMNYEDIRFFSYGESDDPELRNLELHGGWSVEDNYPSVWIVEGARGAATIGQSEQVDKIMNEQYLRFVRSGH